MDLPEIGDSTGLFFKERLPYATRQSSAAAVAGESIFFQPVPFTKILPVLGGCLLTAPKLSPLLHPRMHIAEEHAGVKNTPASGESIQADGRGRHTAQPGRYWVK
jgi:hypothetical protein